MGTALDELVALLDLERIDEDIYRGQNERLSWGRLFGGQVAAQAVAAAQRTVTDRRLHSLHGYFLRGGDPDTPVLFTVDRIRDGRSFTTRRVVAVQDGRAIFNLSASFQRAETGFEHQDPMPEVPGPDEMLSWSERARAAADRLPDEVREFLTSERPFEIRSPEPTSFLSTEPRTGPNPVWLRANGTVPDDPDLHIRLLTYASDIAFVDNIFRPHRSADRRTVHLASLDHALWIHRPVDLNQWLLYHQQSPSAAGARGFALGAFYRADGGHVATVGQEGLMRGPQPSSEEEQ